MIDIDLSTKPFGPLLGPPAAPYIESDTTFTCAEALVIAGPMFGKNGLRLPQQDLSIELPTLAMVVILEFAVGLTTGAVEVEAFDANQVALGPPVVTVPSTALHDYTLVDNNGRIRSLRIFGSNNESFLMRLRIFHSTETL